MTIKELIEMLSAIKDQNAQIYFPARTAILECEECIPVNCLSWRGGKIVLDNDSAFDI